MKELNKSLSLSKEIVLKLNEKDIRYVEELWKLKRKDLKNIGLSNEEIKQVIINLQLIGLKY